MKKIIEMAREAGWTSYDSQDERFEAFADIIRADEREACAKVCDDWPIGRDDVCEIAAFIRARGNK